MKPMKAACKRRYCSSAPDRSSFLEQYLLLHIHNGPYEAHEGHGQGHEQGRFGGGPRRRGRAQEDGLLEDHRHPCRHRTKEVVKTGKFVLPGLCMLKTRMK